MLTSHIKEGIVVRTQDPLFSSILTIPMHGKPGKKHVAKISVQ